MVRVFSIYQFNGQSIHRIPGDIASASLIDTNHLALAKSDHVIEIVSLQNGNFDDTTPTPTTTTTTTTTTGSSIYEDEYIAANQSNDSSNIRTKYAFPTVDEVIEMVYCKSGNFIATIERMVSNSGTEHYECRVYTNWMNCKGAAGETSDNNINFMACNVTIRARIAGRVTPSTSSANCLDVIEIPTIVRSYDQQNQSNAPIKLAVCQRMGTILCAKDRFIKIYKLHECINETVHRFKYIDFIELPMEIELEFVPMQLNIDEHIVGCANAEFMCVFKICEQNFYNTANSLTNTSSELSVMATMPMCTFADQSTDSMLDYGEISKKFLTSITSNISSTFDYQSMENGVGGEHNGRRIGRDRSIELKPNFVDKSIPMCNLRHFQAINDEAYKDYSLRILVQVKQHDANDPFQCLVLTPIYARKSKVLDTANIFRSHYSGGFLGISVLLATVNEGYLYQFSNNEKWTLNEGDAQANGLIATYSFTSPIINVCVTDYVIHALTDHGIETYTHCIGHKLFNNAYEYGLCDDTYSSETAPRIEEQICLIGLRPFLGVQRMFHTAKNLILLARSHLSPSPPAAPSTPSHDSKSKSKSKTAIKPAISAESAPSWTLYNLKMSPADVLYKDFMELAANHKTELTELITSQNSDKVRIYVLLLSEGHVILRIAKDICIDEASSNEVSPRYTRSIERLFRDSCHQLADFYVMSENRDQYCLAYPYYVMGNLSIDQVYHRILEIVGDVPQNAVSMKGAIHTIKSMILKYSDDSEELVRRLTAHIDSHKTYTFGEKLLEFIAKYAPNELAVIGLNSTIFRDTMSNRMCETILQTNGSVQLSKEDRLILVLDSIRNDRRDRARQLLETFLSSELHQLLMANWPILFEVTKVKRTGKSFQTFSELTESYLLPMSAGNVGIRMALLATFRHLVIDTSVVNIELILKLLMDFLASHFGQITLYTSVQSILENLLEAYFHRLYVIRRYSDTLSSASQEMCMKNTADMTSKSANNNDHSLDSTASSENATVSIGAQMMMGMNGSRLNDSIQSEHKGSSITSQMTNGGDANSINGTGGGNGGASASANNDSLSRKHPHNLFSSSFNVEALRILTRIYLSSLKACTAPDFDKRSNASEKPTYLKYIKFMRENFNKVYSQHISQNSNDGDERSSPFDESKFGILDATVAAATAADALSCSQQAIDIQLAKIPILFLLQRPSFLNAMPPISGVIETIATTETTNTDGFSSGQTVQNGDSRCDGDQKRKAIGIVLRLQALLSSGILTRDILQEVLHFIESNVPIFGVDSFLMLLMPFEMCVDYLIEMRPEYLLNYAKCAVGDDQKWQYLLGHITMQFDRIAQNRSPTFYEKLLKDHLDYLVHAKRLPDILNIIPSKYFGDDVQQAVISNAQTVHIGESNGDENGDEEKILSALDNNNRDIFTAFLKLAIDTDRSERLNEMIKTTGFQLYNTYIGGGAGGNNPVTEN